MIQNDNFKFVVHRENFLSVSQCQKLMRYLETGEPTESELAGNYDENILNKKVRDNKEVVINNKQLKDKLQMVFELSNLSIWKYNIQEMERVGKRNKYLCVESYRNEIEKANLLYWQVTCEIFNTPEEWLWWFNQTKYNGDYSFIYFE